MGSSAIRDTRRVLATGNDTGVIAAGYVPYVGATANLNLGAFSLTATGITNSSMTQGSVLFAGAAGLESQDNARFFWDNTNKFLGIGNNTPAYEVDVRSAKVASEVTISTQNTNNTGGSSLQAFNEDSTRYGRIFQTNSASAYGTIYSTNSSFFEGYGTTVGFGNGQSNGTVQMYAGGVATTNVYFTLTPSATSGAITNFSFANRSSTGQTAGSNIAGVLFTASSRQWATGAIATQQEFRITSPTYSFVGASTITNAYSFYVSAPTAGANATITNNWAAGFNGRVAVGLVAPPTAQRAFVVTEDTAWVSIGSLVGATSQGALYINVVTPAANNYMLTGDGATSIINGLTNVLVRAGNTEAARWETATSSGAKTSVTFTASSHTGQTLSTEIPGYNYASYSRQWATGAITTQREQYIRTVTYNFVGASTITNAYGFYVEAPTAGTNATITYNFAAGFSGNAYFSGQVRIGSTPVILGNYGLDVQTAGGINMVGTLNWANGDSQITGARLASRYGMSFAAYNGSIMSTSIRFNTTNTNGTLATGSTTDYLLTPQSWTAITASTETIGFSYTSGAKQWATGALTLQREWVITSPTYSFVGASTLAEAQTVSITAATAGSNATITNNFALGLIAGTSTIKLGQLTGDGTTSAIYMNQATPSTTNYTFNSDGSVLSINAATVRLKINNSTSVNITNTQNVFTTGTGSTNISHNFIAPASTGLTASTEAITFKVTGVTKQWATGALTTQRENYFSSPTISFVGASTLAEAYTMYVEAATVGTNATITNNFALGLLAGTATIKIGNLTADSTSPAIYFNQTTPSNANFALYGTSSITQVNAVTTLQLGAGGSTKMQVTSIGATMNSSRFVEKQGAAVASANNLVLGTDGNFFEITGTTQINLLSNLSYQDGAMVTLGFTSTPTVKHGQATSSTNITIQLAGGVDFAATANDTLTLRLCTIGGTQAWREVSRAVI